MENPDDVSNFYLFDFVGRSLNARLISKNKTF